MTSALVILARTAWTTGTLLVVATITLWLVLGADRGWTKTYVEIPKTDEITGIEYTERVDRFVPGMDFLTAGTIAGFICIFSGIAIFRFTKTKLKS